MMILLSETSLSFSEGHGKLSLQITTFSLLLKIVAEILFKCYTQSSYVQKQFVCDHVHVCFLCIKDHGVAVVRKDKNAAFSMPIQSSVWGCFVFINAHVPLFTIGRVTYKRGK